MVMKTMNMMVEKDVKFMNVLDAKMINTQYGIETYLDLLKNVEVKDIQYVTETASFLRNHYRCRVFSVKK